MKKTPALLISAILLFIPLIQVQANDRNNFIDETQIQNIYNKYSEHLDSKYFAEQDTWLFAAPTYGYKEWTFAYTPRNLMSFATFYKYKAIDGDTLAIEKIDKSINMAINWQKIDDRKIYSFDGAIANFLIVRMIEQVPDSLTYKEIENFNLFINYHLPKALEADDTENRAALAAVYWFYCAKYLENNGFEITDDIYKKIDEKMQKSMNETISKDFLYRENNQQDFSLHYHVLQAYLMSIYGDWTKNLGTVVSAREMTKNFRHLTFNNGLLETSFGKRPTGANAQTYLMAGLLSKRFKYLDYSIYWQYLSDDTFFSDLENPNRLEWHSTYLENKNIFHDDYSFANIAELALSADLFTNFSTAAMPEKIDNQGIYNYSTFWIHNNSDQIVFINRRSDEIKKIKLIGSGKQTASF